MCQPYCWSITTIPILGWLVMIGYLLVLWVKIGQRFNNTAGAVMAVVLPLVGAWAFAFTITREQSPDAVEATQRIVTMTQPTYHTPSIAVNPALLVLAAVLAVGAVGGWVAHDSGATAVTAPTCNSEIRNANSDAIGMAGALINRDVEGGEP